MRPTDAGASSSALAIFFAAEALFFCGREARRLGEEDFFLALELLSFGPVGAMFP
jgi:hypothetical protein